MDDKTVVITGGNSGIGLETAVALAAAGARIVLGCRNPATGRGRRRATSADRSGNDAVETAPLDLSDLASVRSLRRRAALSTGPHRRAGQQRRADAATQRDGDGPGLRADVRHQPPGPLPADRPARSTSCAPPRRRPDRQRGLLRPLRWPSAGIRLERHRPSRRSFSEWRVYGESKLANILHAEALARRLEGPRRRRQLPASRARCTRTSAATATRTGFTARLMDWSWARYAPDPEAPGGGGRARRSTWPPPRRRAAITGAVLVELPSPRRDRSRGAADRGDAEELWHNAATHAGRRRPDPPRAASGRPAAGSAGRCTLVAEPGDRSRAGARGTPTSPGR